MQAPLQLPAFAQSPLPRPMMEPRCLVWYPGDPCDQLIEQYHQAANEQQLLEWQTSVTARFEKQIADQQQKISAQQAQITTLQSKIDSQTMEALRSEASTQAFFDGIGVVIGIGLAFLLVIVAFRRLARNSTRPTQEQSRAASA